MILRILGLAGALVAPGTVVAQPVILACVTDTGVDPDTRKPEKWWFRIDPAAKRFERWLQSAPGWKAMPCSTVTPDRFSRGCWFSEAEYRYQDAATFRNADGSVTVRVDYQLNRYTGRFIVKHNNAQATGRCEKSSEPVVPHQLF